MYNYCKRKSLKLLNVCSLPLIQKLQLNKLSRLDPQGWFQSITHSIGSKTVTLVFILIIVFVVYRCLSIRLVNTKLIWSGPFFFFFLTNIIGGIVRKHLKRGFLCAVLDLSGTLWPLLIPEYSGINQSDFGVGHLVMSMCRVFSCVVGRGCLL